MGNHDWAALARPGLDIDEFNPHARQAVLWTRETLTEESIAFLDQLADTPVQPSQSTDLLLTHASPRQPVYEYILTPSIALENFAAFSEAICLFGHTHRPIIFRWQLHDELHTDLDDSSYHEIEQDFEGAAHQLTAVDERTATRTVATVDALSPPSGEIIQLEFSERQRLIINPGSVGQPRDNDARAAYAILDIEEMTWHYNRVAYPIELTQNQMRAAQLPKRLIDRLSFGL
jgi:diadenosine tetraphosphatase ApaH/serine/threonine PP2A family protein phosphatase